MSFSILIFVLLLIEVNCVTENIPDIDKSIIHNERKSVMAQLSESRNSKRVGEKDSSTSILNQTMNDSERTSSTLIANQQANPIETSKNTSNGKRKMSRRKRRGIIAGAVLGSMFVLALLIFVVYKSLPREQLEKVFDRAYPAIKVQPKDDAITGGKATIIEV